ncbi:extracellular solute-binding protein [Vibrio hannami]|uniref:extracellular solute-binding protein n=1 Tax=Vibrio hannami TaxID=2717094 RepID=UPI00240ED76B|nr:extracellular solute-binding protein [Vibrio hannami]MDG3086356.1 extracellular solute-binding protein [Vibrio hannami]
MRIVIVSFFLLLFQSVQANDSLSVVTYNIPPYSMKLDNRQAGYATEFVNLMLEKLNTNTDITSYPLKRGVFIASRKPNTLVYPISRNSDNERKFHWIGKITSQKISFFKKSSVTNLRPESVDEVRTYDIGVVRGSYAERELKRLGFSNLKEVTEGTQNILKLDSNRIDLIAADELVFSHLIDTYNRSSNHKLSLNQFVKLPLSLDSSHDLYIAASKGTDPKYIHELDDAYDEIQRSGKIIEVAHWWTFGSEKELINVYRNEMEAKGYTWIDYTFEGGAGGNMTQVLRSRLKLNRIPHAIQTYGGPAVREWAQKGVLLNLDQVATSENWQSLLPKMIHDNIQHDGHYVAVPVNMQRVNWMWLNPKVFEKSNASLPTTWETFFVAAEQIKQAGFVPVAIGGYSWHEGTLFESLVLSVGGADFYRSALIEMDPDAFSSSTMTETLEMFLKISQYTDRNKQDRDWLEAARMVSKGEAAINFMGDWVNGFFMAENIPYGENGFLCKPVPNTENLFLVNSDAFAFPKASSINIEGQKQLANIIMNKDVQEAFSLRKGAIPARLDISDQKFNPCAKKSMALAKQGSLIPSFNFHQALPSEIHGQVIDAISQLFNNKKSVEETQDILYQMATRYHSVQKFTSE